MIEKNRYTIDGYIVLQQFFGPKELAGLKEFINPIYSIWMKKSYNDIIEHKLINMDSLTHIDYFHNKKDKRICFFNSLLPPKLTHLIDNMFGKGIYFHNTQLFFNPLDKSQPPYWHRDLQYSSVEDAQQAREQDNFLALHIRTPLVEEIGLELIPGTHRRWDTPLERNVRFAINGHVSSETLPDSTLIPLKPGDILIFSGQMIHRGCYQHNSSRMALDLCVGKYHPFTISFLDPHTLPSSEEMERIPNNA